MGCKMRYIVTTKGRYETLWIDKNKIKDSVNPKIITFIELLIVTYKHENGKKSNG